MVAEMGRSTKISGSLSDSTSDWRTAFSAIGPSTNAISSGAEGTPNLPNT